MNTYEREKALTDKYGTSLMTAIANSFGCNKIERVTDRETQIKGVDYWMWRGDTARSIKQPVDLKFDYYENTNFAFELDTQYVADGVHDASWIKHNGDTWIAYVKIALKKVYIYKLSDLQEFEKESDIFKKRKTFETVCKINGKPGHFKNFRLDELPIHHIVDVTFFYSPFEYDKELLGTKASLLDAVLYKDN